ncbi:MULTISPECIES: PDDEXK nuclease domain-containing protein [unclassified Arthrobacter]|uniref:PDDEXK nuclease domain-containing protein n=1 Tax=unclassified Arthrobacter TaxID=235627 RepID=UPI0033917982
MAHPDDKPTIGLLLCKTKNNVVAEYSLPGFSKPIGVAKWESEVVKSLPAEFASTLPSTSELEAELSTGPGREKPPAVHRQCGHVARLSEVTGGL